MDPNAANIAAARSGKTVLVGSLPNQVPFPDESFDLIVLLDVLEHIGEDKAALAALAAKLKPGGHLLVTVPAFSFLWSEHDESHHHHRRYRLPQLTGLMKQCRLEPTFASYFNTWLFPLIALVRVVLKKLPFARNTDDLSMPSLLLNKLLTHVMTSERHLLRLGRLPFGVSIVALGRKM
jgi:SAM-dependent methyltransferase